MEDIVGQHYMTYEERIQLEALLRHRIPVAEIARELGFARQTICNDQTGGHWTALRAGTLGDGSGGGTSGNKALPTDLNRTYAA